ncbi:MAG TPA: glycosyltransferase family 2 protein [Roseiflexaceae bacterium]|nr:glycosyltransferase family 2 protein [Roseiflexaceae bacterium]
MAAVSVIIPTWNGLRYLPECLGALLPQLPSDAEVLLVENGSTDGTAAWVRQNHPQVRLLDLGRNTGFAGGVAAGLRAARGGLLLLLNNDAFIEPGCLPALLGALEHDPTLGAAGGVLTFAHRPDLVASAGICLRRDGVALDLWPGRAVADLPEQPVPVAGPSGALALYRRALLEDVGLFEPAFFAYLEDVDLALRALLRGWRSVVVPAARARHVYSATGGQGSPFKQRLLGRNRLYVLARCLPGPLLRRWLPLILGYDLLAVGYSLAWRQPAIRQGRIEALRALPGWLDERRRIQAGRAVGLDELARWFDPAGLPWASLRQQQQLEQILQQRI